MADLLVPFHTHTMELGEITKASYPDAPSMQSNSEDDEEAGRKWFNKQRVLMHGHQGWNVRHGLCHIYMIYVYIWVVYSFCLFCCLFIIVTTQFVALYKPCKPKPKPSTYDPPDNHPLAEIQIPILRPEPKQQICHQHANTDHFGK